MRSVDWQAYEDRSLPKEEMRRAESLLAQDRQAQEELQGLRAFREEVRRQGLDVDVPAKELLQALRQATRTEMPKARLSWIRVSIPAAAAILLALGVLWWKHDPLALATTPIAAALESTDIREAETWIERNTGYEVPSLSLPREATVFMARYGEQRKWACIDFVHNGQTYYLYMSPDGSRFTGPPARVFDGNAFYEGQGVGWKTPQMAFYLKGGSESGRWSFATRLAPQTRT